MRQWLTNTLSCVGAPRRTKGTSVRHSYTDVARGTDWLCCVVMCNFCTECPHAVYDRFASPCARRVSISTFTCPIYSPGIIFSISSCSNSNSNVQSVCALSRRKTGISEPPSFHDDLIVNPSPSGLFRIFPNGFLACSVLGSPARVVL